MFSMERLGEIVGWLAGSFMFGLLPALFIYWGVVHVAHKKISGRRAVLIGWGIALIGLAVGWLCQHAQSS